MAPVAAALLMVMPEEEAFWTFCATYEDLLPNFIMGTDSQPGWVGTTEYVEELMRQVCPCVFEHLTDTLPELMEGYSIMRCMGDRYTVRMVTTLFGDVTPLSTTFRVMDLFFCHGPHTIFLALASVWVLCEEQILQVHDTPIWLTSGCMHDHPNPDGVWAPCRRRRWRM